jgi:ABC-type glycerol-3-phosphate transport system permease component
VRSASVVVAPAETVARPPRTARGGQRVARSRRAKVQLASVSSGHLAARAGAFLLGTLWLLVVIVPIYYMVLTSFRSQSQYLSANAWLPTGGLSLSSWAAVFSSTGLWRDFINSVIYSAGTIVVVVVVSLFAAYRIVRRGSRFAAVSFNVILFGLAVPIQALLIPNYVIMVKLRLYDTLYGLVLVTAGSLIAISVLLTVNYVRLIPEELYDAMAIDGANERTVLARLVWPMARPVLGVEQFHFALDPHRFEQQGGAAAGVVHRFHDQFGLRCERTDRNGRRDFLGPPGAVPVPRHAAPVH